MFAPKQSRGGYTLIELLVVISIIAVLAAITVAFLPSVAGNGTEARAAAQLQGWLNIAKTRALRDQAPRGLRLWLDPANPTQTIECQYTEQPDDFSIGVIASNATGDTISFGGTPGKPWTNDLWNGYTGNAADVKYWNVQAGDYLEVAGAGLMHVIQTLPANNTVTIAPPLPYPINVASATPNYRIVRTPRPVGDETLKLPEGTIIDLQTNLTYGNALPPTVQVGEAGFIDILFAPSGAVISRGVSTANINLWVRAPDATTPADVFRGIPTIVSVFVRTGFTGAYGVARSGNPYSLVGQ